MTEIELKFQIPPGRADAVARAVATASARRIRLQAAYADTADRRLAAAGLALRLRREGRRWVQTLKGRGDGMLERPEHEVVVSSAASMPAFEAARHAGTPVGERLATLLGDGAPLHVLYRTDIRRTLRRVRRGGVVVELAHDRGRIEAGGRRLAVDELELELVSGPPAALVGLAERWMTRHGLWWDVRTKSERGFRLAEGLDRVPATKARPSAVAEGQGASQVLAAMLQGALAQVLPNAAEIAADSGTAEHLHQLRVGLRRLRSVLREAAPLAGDAAAAVQALERDWAAPFAALGAARDADVLSVGLWPEIDAALADAGLPPLAFPPLAIEGTEEPGAVVRGALMQTLLLRTLVLTLPPSDDGKGAAVEPVAASAAAALLAPLARRVKKSARALGERPPEELHRLRKRAKRLRYLLEALAPLLRRRRLERSLAALRLALDRLGELNDLHTGAQALSGPEGWTPSTAFALGLLNERRRHLLPQAQQAMDRTFRLAPPWR